MQGISSKCVALSICHVIKLNLRFIKNSTTNKSIRLLIIGFDSNIDSLAELIQDSPMEVWKKNKI